ncbi:hypothetical protein JXA05_02935 [Candidatus Peregrinibacteria bacterium]|nr:hypothetical protein [Candidatus Peregrinibacteria bacterium]
MNFDLYQTPVDYLYLVLSTCIGLLTLFLVIAVYRLIRIFGNVNAITEKAKDTVDLVNHYMWQPIKIALMLIEKGKEFAAASNKHKKKAKAEE